MDDSISPQLAEAYRAKDPRANANIISRLLFFWVGGLFRTGCRRTLVQTDLYACPSEADSEKLLNRFNFYWQMEVLRAKLGRKPRLWVVLVKCLWWRIVLQGTLFFVAAGLITGQSVIVGYLAEYFFSLRDEAQAFNITDNSTVNGQLSGNQTTHNEDMRNAYLLATGLGIGAVVILILFAQGLFIGTKLGMMARIITTSAIYQKTLRLDQHTIGKVSVGHIVNLATNDVQRLDRPMKFLHFIWISPVQLIVFTILVYRELGWSAFIATGMMVLLVPLQMALARGFAYLRYKAAKMTDQRIQVMNEVITGMRIIKMCAWEHAFSEVVTRLRRLESKFIQYGGVIRGAAFGFVMVASSFILYLVFVTYVSVGGELTSRNVFTTLSLVLSLRLICVELFSKALLYCSEALIAIKRVEKFLEFDELLSGQCVQQSLQNNEPFVEVNTLSASWSDRQKIVLENVSFKVEQSECLAIIGSVGAGKSTLLQCLLGELTNRSGSISASGTVSYACQDPWVFSATVRENILFGQPYSPSWYHTVIKACALDKDLAQLVDGDLTLVGERGVTLSGGQKARVNLARAVYRDAEVYLLDDPLSAVDTAVARHLFDKCIRGLLKDHVVILVTHQLQFALEADKILALKMGRVEMCGSLAELEEKGVDPTQLLELIKEEGDDCNEDYYYTDEEEEEEEDTTDDYLRVPLSPKSHQRRRRAEQADAVSIYSAPSMLSLNSMFEGGTVGKATEETAHGSISFRTYYKFLRAGGNHLTLMFIFIIFFLGEGFVVMSDWWLADWVECSRQNTSLRCSLSNVQRISVYSGIILGSLALNFSRAIPLIFLCINASRVLHNRMFRSVLHTPIRFFDINPVGRILNRFSKDTGFLDLLMPDQFVEAMLLQVRVLAVIATAASANGYIVIAAIAVLVVFLSVRWYYLRTSRQIKRLEAIGRSPLYSHIATSLHGLVTIRGFQQQAEALRQFHSYQNEHTQGWYLYIVTVRWLSMRVDVLSTLYLTAVAFISILSASESNAGLVALGLAYSLSLADLFQYGVQIGAEVETTMVSAERIMSYSRLEPEPALDTLPPNEKPPADWPDKGQITMDNVCFQYSSDLPLVLKDLTFSVQPAEKIGIVGRTGAGKSSLLSVLFRLAEPYGSITIDGVETKSLGLHDLRKKISIIPQDPVLFSGTIRYNLDPFDDYSDAELWAVLEQVQLKEAVEQLEGQLEGEVSEGGSNFSVGQRQLVCLARALLRKNKILILDEATANVDARTDSIIQGALREKFADCTVLTIAHRLNTIMDSNKVLVMNKGQVKEFESPHRLLQDPSSQFSKMVDKTGPAASQKLRAMAQEAHLRRRGGGGGRRRSSAARKTSDATSHVPPNSMPAIAEY